MFDGDSENEYKRIISGEIKPRHVAKRFVIGRGCGIVTLGGALALPGRDIADFLSNGVECVAAAATLGAEADRLLERFRLKSISEAYTLEIMLNDTIERYLDGVQAGLGLGYGARFSPGYGDFPLSVQPGLLDMLDARRAIGLSCTREYILTPRKSITAIIAANVKPPGCGTCIKRDGCALRERGNRCGNFGTGE